MSWYNTNVAFVSAQIYYQEFAPLPSCTSLPPCAAKAPSQLPGAARELPGRQSSASFPEGGPAGCWGARHQRTNLLRNHGAGRETANRGYHRKTSVNTQSVETWQQLLYKRVSSTPSCEQTHSLRWALFGNTILTTQTGTQQQIKTDKEGPWQFELHCPK